MDGQQLKELLEKPVSSVGAPVRAPQLLQLAANAPGKVMGDGPCAWAPVPAGGLPLAVSGIWE